MFKISYTKGASTGNASTGIVYTRFIFCFGGFVFVAAFKNVFAAVYRFVDFAVSLGTGALNRKLQNRQERVQKQKHFFRQRKFQKWRNKNCFKPKTSNFG